MPELRMKAPVAMRGGRCRTLTEIAMLALRSVAVVRIRGAGFPHATHPRLPAITYPTAGHANPEGRVRQLISPVRVLDAGEGQVDRGLDEGVVQGRVPLEQPVVERPVDQVERHFKVKACRDLAALDGPAEDGPGLVAAWLDDALLVFGGEGGIGPRLGKQRRDHPGVRLIGAHEL